MDHGSLPKSRLTAVTLARELLCLNRGGSMLNITSQWQDPEILDFCYKSILRKIRLHAETSCAQVLVWSIRPFKRCRRKTGPRETETDSKLFQLTVEAFLHSTVVAASELYLVFHSSSSRTYTEVGFSCRHVCMPHELNKFITLLEVESFIDWTAVNFQQIKVWWDWWTPHPAYPRT